MRSFVDECVSHRAARALARQGHDVVHVGKHGRFSNGSKDQDLWPIAQAEGRLFITADDEFLDRCKPGHYGLILLRLENKTLQFIISRVLDAVASASEADWRNRVAIVHDDTVEVYYTI